MKLKALIILLCGVLESVATILFGEEENRLCEEKDEKLTLVYVSLKTLRNAKTYDQVLDALGFFSEALDFVVETHTDIVEKVDDLKTWVEELQGDKVTLRQTLNVLTKDKKNLIASTNSNHSIVQGLRADMAGMQRVLAETQKELGETRKVNEKLNKLVSQYEMGEVYG